MAVLESFERRGVILKKEVTEGVDSVPTAAANGLLLLNGTSKIEANTVERVIDRPYFGHDPFVLTQFRGTIEGEIELIGAAAPGTASRLSTALQIAGFAEALDAVGPPAFARYNPISTGVPSGSAYFYHAGTLKKLIGGRASISGLSMKIGDYAKAKITILGNVAGDVTEVALPDIDVSGVQTPVAITAETFTLSLNGFNVDGVEFNSDLGIDVGITEHSEARLARIRDRKPTFDCSFYRPAKADLDVYALQKAHTLIPIIALVDGGVGKLTRVTVGFGQIEKVEEVELDKDFGYKISGRCIPSAGNDEIKIEFE
ncbi:MAG: hypothetical protein Q8L45_01725 [Xanthomonadaceae bacterium]|nr:hypothetical protein [Xanthomonadaceae bacterium]MDP2185020.1 hypothetical protein [Xanthomonadales bacterium]MDZ4114399.1 hypothetical protein [Xanthomonadaceae bacterium]